MEQWAQVYQLDPLLVYSFIRTESGFDPDATSTVEARGLMQMTEETLPLAAEQDRPGRGPDIW